MPEAVLDLTRRDSFCYWVEDIIRFADVDRYGHVNNVASAVYCESGRAEMFNELFPGSIDGTGVGWVIARITINYLKPAYYPGKVDIGHVVTRIGNSSLGLSQGLFTAGACFGTADSVLVWSDTLKGTSLPLPDDIRETLRKYLA